MFKNGAKQSAITHGHPEGYLSAGFYAGVCYELINNIDIITAINNTSQILNTYAKNDVMKEIIKNTLMAIKNYPYLKNNALNDVLGCGWIGEEALAIALFCATTGRDFKTVLEVSSNHSGDSDSTAMLSIGLWYLKTRDDSFLNDAETINKLDLKNCIENYMNSI